MNNGDGSRVFNIDDGNIVANIDVEIIGLTLTGGDVTRHRQAEISIVPSIAEDLSIRLGSTNLTGTRPRSAAACTASAAIRASAALTVASSTISGNSAVRVAAESTARATILTVTDSTISGNAANSSGGGISYILTVTVRLAHSTITGNVADADEQ